MLPIRSLVKGRLNLKSKGHLSEVLELLISPVSMVLFSL
jgi:hypothetical protein